VREGAIESAKGDVLTYSYGIARNLRRETIRGNRKKNSETSIELSEPKPKEHDPVFSEMADEDELGKLRRAIASLKDEEREVVLLLINEDLSMEEIATSLHMPVGTVKSHLHRARVHLKSILDPLMGASEQEGLKA
jgi:RNA polymerase sigma-70 factor (ECF subfamily)